MSLKVSISGIVFTELSIVRCMLCGLCVTKHAIQFKGDNFHLNITPYKQEYHITLYAVYLAVILIWRFGNFLIVHQI